MWRWAWVGQTRRLCVFSPTCGAALAMEHTGDLYSCDHYVEPDYLLGNISETHDDRAGPSPKQRKFGQDKLDTLPQYCRDCEVRFVCHGGCPKNRFMQTPDGEPGLNYLCAGYKAFFNHIDRPMQVMANLLRRSARPPKSCDVGRGRKRDQAGPASRRPQRSVPLRQRQEVQTVPRALSDQCKLTE